MRKIIYIILLTLFILFPVNVFAEGYISASPTSLTIEQGSSKTFEITAYNAIGDVSIESNDSNIASVNIGEWETGMVDEKQTKSETITVTGNKVGTTTITILIDGATFDSDDLSGQIKTIDVNVVAKQNTNLSSNNNLKTISIDGYRLTKIDNNNYTVTVPNDVTSININAVAEDSKAQVTGIGEKELSVGENNFEVVITAETGAKNRINIKVTRNDKVLDNNNNDNSDNNNNNNNNNDIVDDGSIDSNPETGSKFDILFVSLVICCCLIYVLYLTRKK